MLKRVLFVYHVSTIGGGSFALLNILKNIDRSKIEPFLLLRTEGPLVDEVHKLGINILYMHSLRRVPYNDSMFKLHNLRSIVDLLSSLKDFNLIIKDIKPDVVYINTMMMYPYLSVAKKNKIKTVIHIREHWPQHEHPFQRNIALRAIAKNADQIIAINKFSASMITPFGVTPTIVYDWVDMDARFKQFNLENIFCEDLKGKKVFLYLGGIQKTKGAYEIMKCFTSELLNDNYRLLALGIPNNYSYEGIRGRLSKVLSVFGYKTYENKVIEIAKSDKRIVCFDSIYELKHLYEQVYCVLSYFTIPHANLALAESIICKAINIAALTEESLEYSYNGELAILFEENNIKDFKEKIVSLEKVYAEYKSRLSRDSHYIKELFDPQTNIKKLNYILNQI